MVIFKKINDLKEWLSIQKKDGKTIGFVPTMGALHRGHTSLVGLSVAQGNHTVCSVFVNPTQFNDKEDFNKYPLTPEADIALLAAAGCHVLFLPAVEEMYPAGFEAQKAYSFGYLESILEGAKRPGHFKGVGQIVGRLLEIVEPNKLYMGQKDYQQCQVVKDLIRQMSIGDKTELMVSPTVREADGLAMSSRNTRLTESQRAIAGIIYQCLVSIQSKQGISPFSVVEKECKDLMEAKGLAPEYVALADAGDLTLLDDYESGRKMVALIATKLGSVRLIDNLVLE